MPRQSLVLGAALITLMQPLRAQTVEEFRGRADRLSAVYQRARALADSADGALRSSLVLDTIVLGPMIVLASPRQSTAARAGARRAWEALRATLRSDTTLLSEVAFYVPGFGSTQPTLPGRTLYLVRVRATRAALFERQLLGAAASWLSEDIDTVFGRWLGQALPTSLDVDWEDAWAQLATAPSRLAHGCRTRNLRACRQAFALAPTDDPIREWYDADGRRGLIRQLPGLIRQDPDAAAVCLDRGWDPVCITLLQLVEREAIPPPLGADIRAGLLRYALATGGDGAYHRILGALRSPTPPGVEAVLALAADRDADSLLADWITTVQAARPGQVTLEPLGAAAAILWAALFALISLRNTRWR